MGIAKGPEKWCCDRLGDRLIAYSPLFPFILGAAAGDWNVDRFWALCQLLGCPLVDRTQTLFCPLNMKVLHPIPAFKPSFNMTLPKIIEDRANQILHTYPNQEIQILWSGGIDTTAVVVAFLKITGIMERERLKIRYCSRSVQEYPLFFERFIKNEFKHEVIHGHVRDAFKAGTPTVTGDPADMLMGTFVMGRAFLGSEVDRLPNPLSFALESPWEDVIPAWMRVRGLLGLKAATKWKEITKDQMRQDVYVRSWLSWIKPFVSASPIPIVTTFDWLWWVTYACKYQHDLLRVFYNREIIPPELVASCVNFYQTEDFDQWSFHNHEEKMPNKNVWATYKMPLKKYIVDYTNDTEYFAYKTKVLSVRNSWGYELAIDENWNVIRFGELSISLRRLEEKYGDRLDRFIHPKSLQTRERKREHGDDPIVVGCSALAYDNDLTLAALMLCCMDPYQVASPHPDIHPGAPDDRTQAKNYDPKAAGGE